jgi:hypothetical protein
MNAAETIDALASRSGEQLFQFAIDRGDMQAILNSLPPTMQENRVALEYEMQLLRIISVGWAIAFFLADDRLKNPVGQHFWENIRTFAATLSSSASLTVGTDIDYFDTVKQRLDFYVGTLESAGGIDQPAMAIGPAFAEVCGDKNDACATLAGSKMFTHTVHAVREYLQAAVDPQDDSGDPL